MKKEQRLNGQPHGIRMWLSKTSMVFEWLDKGVSHGSKVTVWHDGRLEAEEYKEGENLTAKARMKEAYGEEVDSDSD